MLESEIKEAYEKAKQARIALSMLDHQLEDMRLVAKLTMGDEWVNAKNNDVRKMMVERYFADNMDYAQVVEAQREAKLNFRLAMLDVEYVKALILAH